MSTRWDSVGATVVIERGDRIEGATTIDRVSAKNIWTADGRRWVRARTTTSRARLFGDKNMFRWLAIRPPKPEDAEEIARLDAAEKAIDARAALDREELLNRGISWSPNVVLRALLKKGDADALAEHLTKAAEILRKTREENDR